MESAGYVHLLLNAPGQPPATLPPSPSRLWVVGDRGAVDVVTAAGAARPPSVGARAERNLVAAVAHDDVDAIVRLGEKGPVADAARVLAAGRLATVDGTAASDLLERILASPAEVGSAKVLRRHWPGLHVHLTLAPSVPALFPVGRSGLTLLRAELLTAAGRLGDAVALLEAQPPQPAIALTLAATLLAHGEHQRVIDVTTHVENVDDLSALTLVARSVAARLLDDPTCALDAACAALAVGERNPSILATALEERAHLHSQRGDEMAARADLEALAALVGGSSAVSVPEASALRRPEVPAPEEETDDALDRARHRLRRRITGVGAPGTFGGRHHSTYRDEVGSMVALGQLDAVEELLLGLMDAVEDEVTELGAELDPTFFLTLGDLYQDSGRTDDHHALQERYAAAVERARAVGGLPAGEGDVLPAPPVAPSAVDPSSVAVADPTAASAPSAVADPTSGPDVAAAPPAGPVGSDPEMAMPAEPPAPGAPEPEPERPPTPVERAVRGPRVRSL